MAEIVPSNNPTSTLASGIAADATSLTLATGEGARFSSPAGSTGRLVITRASDNKKEILTFTTRSTDTLSGLGRAAEAVAGDQTAYAFVTGDAVSEDLTQASLTALLAPARPAFSVHRNGSVQSITASTPTKVQWTTEEYDVTGDFDSSTNYRFTPSVAGKYLLVFCANWGAPGSTMTSAIYKNGSLYKEVMGQPVVGSSFSVLVAVVADANGSSDYFEAYVTQTNGTKDLAGTATDTYFQGALL